MPIIKSSLAHHDALDFLTQEHQRIAELFRQFTHLQREVGPVDSDAVTAAEAKEVIVIEACAQLSMHAQLEEEIFYPALFTVLDSTLLLEEADLEHQSVKRLMFELESMDSINPSYGAKFMVLKEQVGHHVAREEQHLFLKAIQSGIDLDRLGNAMRQRKGQLLMEAGLDPD